MPGEELFCPQLQETLDARDCTLTVDLTQALVIVTCGFLVGSYMKTFNIDHYNALLSTIPKFAACPISIVMKNVQLGGKKTAPRSLQLMCSLMLPNARQLFKFLKHSTIGAGLPIFLISLMVGSSNSVIFRLTGVTRC